MENTDLLTYCTEQCSSSPSWWHWSFCLAIHHISSHRCCGRPIALTMRCRMCSSNTSTVAGFATSTIETVSHRGMALLQPEHHWPNSSTVACSTTCMCPCKCWPLWAQTVTDVIVCELLRRLFHIGNFCFWVPFFKTAVAQKLCGGFCWNLQRLCQKGDN